MGDDNWDPDALELFGHLGATRESNLQAPTLQMAQLNHPMLLTRLRKLLGSSDWEYETEYGNGSNYRTTMVFSFEKSFVFAVWVSGVDMHKAREK